jgi:GxxExxY protein
LREIEFWPQVPLPVVYKGTNLDCGYRMDFVVPGFVLVEVKSVEALHPIHLAQVLTCLKLCGLRKVPLINFNLPALLDGIRRVVNGFQDTG